MEKQKNFIVPTFSDFILRLFSGIGGGLLGTSAALLAFLLSEYISKDTMNIQEEIGFSGFAILWVVFSGSLVGNLFAIFFHTLADKEKYRPRFQIIKNTFWINIFLFLFSIPFYLFSIHLESLLTIAGMHFFLSASASLLVAEFIASRRGGTAALIGVSVVQMTVFSIYSFLTFKFSGGTVITILFLPLVWLLLPTMVFVMEKIRSLCWSIFEYDLFGRE